MTTDPFGQLMAQLDPPLIVVTTADERERAGCLVGFHAQSGLEPGNLTVWLSKANHTFRVAVFAEMLAVHFLTSGDRALAQHFGTTSGDEVDKFSDVPWEPGPGGLPLLEGCPNRVVGHKLALLDTRSDHVCVVLDPAETHFDGPFTPLRLSDVGDLEPGHDASDRPEPPTTRAPDQV